MHDTDDTTADGNQPLGRRLAKLRAGLGWTQTEVAERVGISRVALSHLESGLSVANERTVALLAGLYRLEPHALIAGTDYPLSKAERLPAVTARYTEVEHQLALARLELAWAERLASPAERAALGRRWSQALTALLAETYDQRSRWAVEAALRAINLSG